MFQASDLLKAVRNGNLIKVKQILDAQPELIQ